MVNAALKKGISEDQVDLWRKQLHQAEKKAVLHLLLCNHDNWLHQSIKFVLFVLNMFSKHTKYHPSKMFLS
ncbi:MAG: hypothetical protein CM15mP66_04100 [Pseudomonadota bacterium]|nr:MAG: hypothetical protein CM15mP66_04100 [Pseudomonadota bacterium]